MSNIRLLRVTKGVVTVVHVVGVPLSSGYVDQLRPDVDLLGWKTVQNTSLNVG